MTQPGSIVKCIKGAEGFLTEGSCYTVWDVTEDGHYRLEEVDPPEPFNCFNKDRFEDTGDFVVYEDQEMGMDWEPILEEELDLIEI